MRLAKSILFNILTASLGMTFSAGSAGATTLFLDGWGVSYGSWATPTAGTTQIEFEVEDWISGGNGYLGPGYGGDAYDAEAAYFGYDSQYFYLAVVTGFPLSGRWDPYTHELYLPGDIAIDLNADGSYEYAVDVDAGGILRSQSLVWQNPSINGGPAWGGVMDPLRATSWNHSAAISGFRYGWFDGRYSIEAIVPRALIASADSYTMHWTMGCGNDGLEVNVNPIPEPGSLVLLGAGLTLSGVLLNRRRRNA